MGGMGSGRRRRQSMETYIQIRVSKAEKKDLQERLAMQGMDMSVYIRKLIQRDKKEGYICRY